MPAELEADVSGSVAPSVTSARKKVDTRPWLAPYRFQKGKLNPAHTNPHAHRPVGSRNVAAIYLESLPKKARQWVQSTDAKILSEARQIAARVDAEPLLDLEPKAPVIPSVIQIVVVEPLREGMTTTCLQDTKSSPVAIPYAQNAIEHSSS